MSFRLLTACLILAICVATDARPLPRHSGAVAAVFKLPARRLSFHGVTTVAAGVAGEQLQLQHPRSLTQQQAAGRPAKPTEAELHDAVLDQRAMDKVYSLEKTNKQPLLCFGRWC